MTEDPRENERRFREAAERAAAERRASRPQRRLLRLVGSLALFFVERAWLVVAVVAACFVGLFVLIFGLASKWTDAYACSLAEARRNPTVIAELGEPIEPGFFAWSGAYRSEASVTDTSFRTALEGPKGEGTLRVQWYTSPVGSRLRMEMEKDGQKRTLYDGPVPCR